MAEYPASLSPRLRQSMWSAISSKHTFINPYVTQSEALKQPQTQTALTGYLSPFFLRRSDRSASAVFLQCSVKRGHGVTNHTTRAAGNSCCRGSGGGCLPFLPLSCRNHAWFCFAFRLWNISSICLTLLESDNDSFMFDYIIVVSWENDAQLLSLLNWLTP